MTVRTYMTALLEQRERKAIEARQGKPYPRRITQALDSRELYGPEVDIACGAVEPAVDRWETGEEVPTWEQLEKLAELTHYPIAFFFMEPGEPLTGFMCIRGGKGKGCYPLTGDPPADVEQLDLIPEEAVERVSKPPRPDPPPPGDLPECSGPCGRPMKRQTWVRQHGRCSACGPA